MRRFWDKVDKSGDCWIWTSAINHKGYGVFWMNTLNRAVYAHRLAYQLVTGTALVSAQFLCHRCDNPKCVRPDHLFIGDAKANMADCAAKGRTRRGAAHYSAKLTEDDVIDIRTCIALGASQRDLATAYGISGHAVACIRSGRSWAWL